jgi:hypothetical protein
MPPASHSVPIYPGINIGTTIRAIWGDSLAERRTLEDLRREHAEIERKICNSAGTSQQCRDWNKEKQRLLEAIKAKEIADGFIHGPLVPYREHRKGHEIWRFIPSSDCRRQTRKAMAYSGKVARAHRRKLNESNFDGTRGEIRAKSEDKKTVNLLSGRSYCSLQKGSTRSVEILAPFTRLKRA